MRLHLFLAKIIYSGTNDVPTEEQQEIVADSYESALRIMADFIEQSGHVVLSAEVERMNNRPFYRYKELSK